MATEAQERKELVDELLGRIGRTVGDHARASSAFGEAVEREGVTVIPVARARFGFGGGSGGGKSKKGEEGTGGGGGGGAVVTPVGYIEIRGGTAEFKRIAGPQDLVLFVAAVSLGLLAARRLLGD